MQRTLRYSSLLEQVAVTDCAIFSAGLNATPRLEDLAGPGPWTLLVPTDEAFVGLSTEAMDAVLRRPLPLTELLLAHLVSGIIAGRDLAGFGWLLTAGGEHLPVDVFGAVVLIDGAKIIRADLPLSFGLAHVIDRVLLRTDAFRQTKALAREE